MAIEWIGIETKAWANLIGFLLETDDSGETLKDAKKDFEVKGTVKYS